VAEEKFSYVLGLKIHSIKLNKEDARETLKWSVEKNATYHNSMYIETSHKIGATLVTADDFLYEKARKHIPTLHLRNYRK